MNKVKEKFRRALGSLRTRFVILFAIAIIIGALVYFLGGLLSGTVIRDYYLSSENKAAREREYHENLQEYIDDEGITFETIDRVSEWVKKNQYVYLLIYKEQTDDEAYYVPDDEADKKPTAPPVEDKPTTPNGDTTAGEGEVEGEGPGDDPIGGITIDWPTRSELEEEAKKKDMLVIELPENQYVYAKFAEFTEYLYYDITNIASLGIAVAIILIILLLYMTRLTKRISSLGADVNTVAAGNTEKIIEIKGEDELALLARNVETMRSSIVESFKRKREAMDANTELITSMSHDIRTPLTVLLGYIDVMRNHAEGDREMQEYLSAAENTAMRLKKLSDDMFGYFLVFAGEGERLDLESYDVITTAEQLLTEHILLIRESGYEVAISIDDGALSGKTVRLDIASIIRIIDNIFSNLYKYADKSEPILISVGRVGDKAKISVENKIRRDEREVESNRIGLKTCAKLAENMGAEFEHFSTDDTFIVNISFQIE